MEESINDNQELTEKQKIFCEEYVIDWNATRAAEKAGYSENSSRSIASENLTKPNIKAYIEELKEKTAELAGISPLSQVLELKKIAYSNIASLFEGWVTLADFEGLTEDQKSTILEISYSTKTTRTDKGDTIETEFVKIKQYDKLLAIREINKMLGFNAPEKKDVTSGGEPIKGILPIEWVK